MVTNTVVLDDRNNLSDIQVDFKVLYRIFDGVAVLQIESHTRAAEDYGVRYQLGYAHKEEDNLRLSPPMSIDEASNIELRTNIFNGGYLVIRMVDKESNHLAA